MLKPLNQLLSFSLLFLFLGFSCFASANSMQEKEDSLRNLISGESGEQLVELELELASLLFDQNNKEARVVAESALENVKTIDNELLQFEAYYVLGKITHVFDRLKRSRTYFDTALVLANKMENNWHLAEVLLRIGINQHAQGEHIDALESFTSSVKAGRESNNHRIIGAAYSMMGTIYRVSGLYDRAIEYVIKAKYSYQQAEFQEGAAWSAYILGRIYRDLQLYQEALENLNEALLIYQEIEAVDKNRSGIGICHEQLGLLYLENNEPLEAREHILYTLEIYTEINSAFGISNAHKNLGKIEYHLQNYSAAIELLNKALDEKNDLEEKLSMPDMYHYLGLCEIELGQEKQGLQKIEKGLVLASENQQKRIELNIYKSLTEIYLKNQEIEKAVYCLNRQIAIQDSMLLGAATDKHEQLRQIYEVDEKNHLIYELEKTNELNRLQLQQNRSFRILLGIGIGITLLIIFVVSFFYRRLRQKNKALAQASATKDRFFGIIGHDLRGPSQNLTTLLEHMHGHFYDFDAAEIRHMLKASHQSSEKVSQLLDKLLVWANSQRNRIEIRPEQLDLSNALQQVVSDLQETANYKEIKINHHLKPQLLVWADANMLHTIFRNLISNAIKFTPRKGSVSITSQPSKDNRVLIQITDTGVGMSKQIIKGIFDHNQNHHTPGTENENSTGLGLILVKEFVDKNKGIIQIKSTQGVGTTVSVWLPVS